MTRSSNDISDSGGPWLRTKGLGFLFGDDPPAINLQSLLKSPALGTFYASIAILAMGMVNSVELSRWLGAGGRGELAAAILWPTLLAWTVSLGVGPAILYYAALPGARTGDIFATSLVLGLAQSAVAVLVGYLALPLILGGHGGIEVTASRWYLLMIPLGLISNYASFILQARLRFVWYNVLRAFMIFGSAFAVLGLKLAGRLDVIHVVFILLLLSVLQTVVSLVGLHSTGMAIGPHFDRPLAGKLLKYGLKVHFGSISQLGNEQLDQMLMSIFLQPVQLGLYVVAVSAAGVNGALAFAVRNVSMPRIAGAAQDRKVMLLSQVFRRFFVVSIFSAVAMASILPAAIPLIFGNQFSRAIWPAEILLLAGLFLGWTGILTYGALAMNNPFLSSRSSVVALVVTLVSLPPLLYFLGILGAAIASLIAYATQFFVVAAALRKTHGFHFNPRNIPAVSSNITML